MELSLDMTFLICDFQLPALASGLHQTQLATRRVEHLAHLKSICLRGLKKYNLKQTRNKSPLASLAKTPAVADMDKPYGPVYVLEVRK